MKISLSGVLTFKTSQDEYPEELTSYILAVLQKRVTIHFETRALKYL